MRPKFSDAQQAGQLESQSMTPVRGGENIIVPVRERGGGIFFFFLFLFFFFRRLTPLLSGSEKRRAHGRDSREY